MGQFYYNIETTCRSSSSSPWPPCPWLHLLLAQMLLLAPISPLEVRQQSGQDPSTLMLLLLLLLLLLMPSSSIKHSRDILSLLSLSLLNLSLPNLSLLNLSLLNLSLPNPSLPSLSFSNFHNFRDRNF